MVKKDKTSKKNIDYIEPTDDEEQKYMLTVGMDHTMRELKNQIDKDIKESQELKKKDIEREKRIAEKRAKRLAREAAKSLDKNINSESESSSESEPERKPPAAIDKSSLLEAFDKKSSPPRSKKDLNKYKLSKTAEIKVPDKVIDVNNGRIKLVDTLDNKGDINKVDGHKVIDIISYIPDSIKDSKIKVKQGSNSDISKEIKKLEGKIKRSKKPTTIEKLNTELNNLLEKIEVI